jgi:hypothetical protein
MRPQYEKPSDLAAEKAMIAEAFPNVNVVAHKLPQSYRIDYLLEYHGIQGIRRAWCECKARNVPFGTYEDYMLSLGKFAAGCELARSTGYPFLLLVHWTDCLTRYAIPTDPRIGYRIEMGGRTDRADWQDVEPVVMIPVDQFKKVNRRPDAS